MSPHPNICAAYELPYTRHPDRSHTTRRLLADAVLGVLRKAGLELRDVDGLGVASFTLDPDHGIDLAARLGLSVRWLMQDPLGGASGLNLLQHACRAVEAGDAEVIVLVAGDNLLSADGGGFKQLADNYNLATQKHLAPLDYGGPNSLFAMLTQRHMAATGLTQIDYAQIPLAQRRWAAGNPQAVYRSPLTIDDYLAAPVVTSPLRRYDCVPVAAGADALVVTGRGGRGVRVLALEGQHNTVDQSGDGLTTGHRVLQERLWDSAGFGPDDVSVVGLYDDYPVIVIEQLVDLGFVAEDDVADFLHGSLARGFPLNTSGGQLSVGQAGSAGGMHFLVEAVRQLLGEGGERQVPDARRALVSGYGMVLYRYGACANAAVLEVAP